MFIDIDKIVGMWEKDEPNYKRLSNLLLPILKNAIYELELYPETSFRIKDLLSLIRKLKKKNILAAYSYEEITDKLGFRIICSFSDDLELIDKFIIENFIVLKIDKKKDFLDPHKLDYISNHYDLSIDVSKKIFRSKKFLPLKKLVFELQVRTLNQHAWSNTSHALSYKQEVKLSNTLTRKIFRLLSLYEIADDEFSIVNSILCSNPENIVYSLLRKTEGKIYKYAKTDFDREISIYVFNILVTYFTHEQLSVILKEIDLFIESHKVKIRRIFAENVKRYHQIPFLIQPEIFIIWFALEKFPFSITNEWENDFDKEELEQIQTLWGKEIS